MTVKLLKPQIAHDRTALQQAEPKTRNAKIDIGEREYVISDLSVDGSAVIEFDGKAEPGQLLETTIHIPFDSFELSMPVTCEVKYCIAEGSFLGVQFVNLPKARMDTLLSIIGSFTAGEMVNADDVMNLERRDVVPSTETVGSRRTGSAQLSDAMRRRIGAMAFIVLAAALFVFIAANLWSRAFQLQADGAVVSPEAIVLRMPKAAELMAYSAAEGARLLPASAVATLRTDDGNLITIPSGCDCVMSGRFAQARAFLTEGAPIAQLVPSDGTSVAVLSVELDQLRRVRVGDQVTASFYDDGAPVAGTVERVTLPTLLEGAPANEASLRGKVEVRFAQKLPASRVGEPIAARIHTSRFNPFG